MESILIQDVDPLARFRAHLYESEHAEATVQKYLRDVGRFLDFVGETPFDRAVLLDYKAHIGKSHSPSGANSILAAVNAYLRFIERGDLTVKPFRVQKQVFCPEEKELTKSEYFRLCRAARDRKNARLALLIETVCGTGIRISELRYITREAALRGEAVVTCKGKTRVIFLVSGLRKKLLKYAKSRRIASGAIFVTRSGVPMNRSNIWREMKALCESADVAPTKVFPHNLRHLFARTFYAVEKDIVHLADILGHSNVNTTRIYLIQTGAEHRRCMEQMRLIS